MGHDVWAYRKGIAVDAASAEHKLDDHDDGWLDRYAKYCRLVYVAQLRRSAFDSWNKTIYTALDAEDLYGGCSGTGGEREFTLKQIVDAIAKVGVMLESPAPKREPNFADDLLGSLKDGIVGDFDKVQTGSTDRADDLSEELGFLFRCQEYLESSGEKDVVISFG